MREIISHEATAEERPLENGIRPRLLADFIGQDKIIENLQIFIKAAKKRKEPLDHVLLHGSPGLGKTTLANIIANEMGVSIKTTSGPVIERAGDLAALLTNLSSGDVLFIDEIHRLNPLIEEILYPAMEDYAIDLVIGQGPNARSIRLDIPKFTLIGATTRTGLLTPPLRDRFGVMLRVDFYPPDALYKIIKRSAEILSIKISDEGAQEIARRSRGTPRIANRLLRRVRDFAEVEADGVITKDVASRALTLLNVDEKGLDNMDRLILETIINKFSGGPVGIDTIAVTVGEEGSTIEDVYEPFLIQEGYVKRTPRGRVATMLAYERLGRIPISG